MNHRDVPRKASYGLDAPLPLTFAAIAMVAAIVYFACTKKLGPLVGAVLGATFIGLAFHSSSRGKFLVWRDELDRLRLRGDEKLLDLGCGRGAVLLAAARRVPNGRAYGIDRWSRADQSGNAAAATRRNAEAERVVDRVELATADMTKLPFRSDSFDVITSSIAIHNIPGRPARNAAVEEAVRVLRPGGRLALADLAFTRDYVARLTALGMLDVRCHSLGWRMWWGGPWRPTRVVTATKPSSGNATSR